MVAGGALGLAAALAAFVVVVGIGLTAALVVSHHGGGERGFITNGRDGRGDFDQQGPKGMGRGNGTGPNGGPAQGDGNRNAVPQPPGQGAPAGPRQGMGLGAGAALGAVLHGEFTTSVTGTPTVMVVQSGQVTAYTAGKSMTVKSTDGFTATYTLDGTTRYRQRGHPGGGRRHGAGHGGQGGDEGHQGRHRLSAALPALERAARFRAPDATAPAQPTRCGRARHGGNGLHHRSTPRRIEGSGMTGLVVRPGRPGQLDRR